ncbi:MAG: UDP-N-acetylglucosamine-peptide N-acetylglucosaminyltransferase [Sandaracinus sp.]|nr:UDP-N-acetylglucosamine-peptide N-acetylglucosaminyltransferase [Sandaracinus sp.]
MSDERTKPKSGSAHTELSRAWDLLEAGDLQGARQAARATLEHDAESPEAFNTLGYILALEGDLEEALAHYEQALANDEGYFEAYLNAADVKLRLGDVEGALEAAEQALEAAETDDDAVEALLLQMDVLLAAGRVDEADALVGELPDGPFESPALELAVGRARWEAGDQEGAAELIEHAAGVLQGDPDAQYQLGLLREAGGDLRAATAAFLTARALEGKLPRPVWAEPATRFERRVGDALRRLPAEVQATIEGALVLVEELPGAEIVAEGFDPRSPVLADTVELGKGQTLTRVVVYQRNFERLVADPAMVDSALESLLGEELGRAFES